MSNSTSNYNFILKKYCDLLFAHIFSISYDFFKYITNNSTVRSDDYSIFDKVTKKFVHYGKLNEFNNA